MHTVAHVLNANIGHSDRVDRRRKRKRPSSFDFETQLRAIGRGAAGACGESESSIHAGPNP
jgi:hypothetical protein